MKLDIDLSERAEKWWRRQAVEREQSVEECIADFLDNWLKSDDERENGSQPNRD